MKFLFLFFLSFLYTCCANADLSDFMTLFENSTQPENCKEDNRTNCAGLGYTISSNSDPCGDLGAGVACPFDPEKWRCPDWKCSELNLFDLTNMPKNSTCSDTQRKGKDCQSCTCLASYIDTFSCPKARPLLSEDLSCEAMGYTSSISRCERYIACPTNSNKVHCLDTSDCQEENASCIIDVEIPQYAEPKYETRTCSCGGAKSIIVGWDTCKSGYKVTGTGANKTCVEKLCSDYPRQFDTSAEENCYNINISGSESILTSAYGWEVGTGEDTGLVQCYQCNCDTSSETFTNTCPYSGEPAKINNTPVEEFREVCCDAAHYRKCDRKCPTGFKSIPNHAVPHKKSCTACGKTTTYVDSWSCKNGYTKVDERCDITACPSPSGGEYYSASYRNVSDCGSEEGWSFRDRSENNYKSGEDYCHICSCAISENDSTYKYTEASGSGEYMVLTNKGCNGKYKTCALSARGSVDLLTGGCPAHGLCDTYNICSYTGHLGTPYYRLGSCVEGYEPDQTNHACVEATCEGYTLTQKPTSVARLEYRECKKGENSLYKLEACYDDAVAGMDYEILYENNIAKRCCLMNCPTGYEVDKTCEPGQTATIEVNDCGRNCIKCN